MIPITYNSQALYLLDDLPDWARPFKATASLVTAQESGLTDREARRAHGETLRLRLAYQIKASGTAARLLAGSLRAHQNEPVCAPLWPAACAWSDRASAEITGGLKAVFPAAGGTPTITEYNSVAADSLHVTAVGGTITTATVTGNGAGKTFKTLQGFSGDSIQFPSGVLPSTYTLFHVARYSGAMHGRIFGGNGNNWLSGFWGNCSGVCHHDGWVGGFSDIHGTNWVISTDQNSLYRSNFVERGNSGGYTSTSLCINTGTNYGEFSDWQVAEVIVFNRTLTATEYQRVESYLKNRYFTDDTEKSLPADISGLLAWYDADSWTGTVWKNKVGFEATDTFVPLVVGYLGSRDNRWITDTFSTFDVDLIENSPNSWAITPAAYTAPAGPLPSGYATAPRLFPFLTHWDGPRTGYTLRIARDEIGFGRQTSDVARASAVARTVEQTAWASTADGWSAAKLLAFFAAHGAGASFWASGQQSAAVLAADLPASATTATITDTTGLVIGDRLGLVQKGQLTGWVGPLTGIVNPTLSFVSSGNAASPAATTSLVPLLLARFDSPKLELEWITDRLATASFRVRELPPELALPAGETLGTTLGNLTPRAWLYEFTKTFPGATVVSRYTSYERDLTYGGNTYTAKKLTHGDIKTGLALDRDELSIDCDGLEIPFVLDVALLRCEVPLMLTVRRAEITGAGTAGNATTAWSGEVSTAAIKAKRLSAKAVALGSAFDRKAPRFYLQPGCNHGLFSVGCGLSASAFAHTATLTAVGTAGYPYTFTIGSIARAGGAVLTAADVFVGGWIEIGGGASLTRRAILASTAVSGGACVLTLSGDPSPFPSNGTAIVIYPGCDGRKETCATTFNNFLNFGGHPFVPTGNPSLFKLSSDAGSGGKK